MALDISTFKTRAISATIFGIIMLGALLGGKEIFFIVFAIISFIAGKEFYFLWSNIYKQPLNETIQLVFALACSLVFMAIAQINGFLFLSQVNANFNIYIGAAIVITILWLAMYQFKNESLKLLFGYIYIGIGFGFLALCYTLNAYYPLFLICLIWINDTMQYIVGSFIGKTKMAPITSPKKTWEGTIGGSLLCIITAIVFGFVSNQFSIITCIIFGLTASVFGTLGDLLESKLKRTANVKDSGNIMPGHGGALDRFDSLLLAAPCLYIILLIFNK